MSDPGYHMNDEILVSYLLHEGDPETRSRVEQWIIEKPEHARYFEHFKIIWDASKALEGATEVNENEAWSRFLEKTSNSSTPVISIRKRLSPVRIAATILIIVTLAAIGYAVYDYSDRSPVLVGATQQPETKLLPDGSEIILNKNSTVQYTRKLRGEKRSIKLKGEAFFKVTPDKNKPFVVDVNDVTVTVLGTSFNVKGYDGSTEVVVETGTVRVESKGRGVVLQQGERVKIANGDSTLVEQQSVDKLYNYYVTKEFVCDNTPLWKLVEVLNEAYNAQIEIVNPDIRQLPLTTTFRNESLDNILIVIGETFNITITKDGDRILMN